MCAVEFLGRFVHTLLEKTLKIGDKQVLYQQYFFKLLPGEYRATATGKCIWMLFAEDMADTTAGYNLKRAVALPDPK